MLRQPPPIRLPAHGSSVHHFAPMILPLLKTPETGRIRVFSPSKKDEKLYGYSVGCYTQHATLKPKIMKIVQNQAASQPSGSAVPGPAKVLTHPSDFRPDADRRLHHAFHIRQAVLSISVPIRVNSCEFVVKNQLLIRGKLAAATACPTRLLFSSGKCSEIFCASSGKSARNTSFAFWMMKSPPMPEVTRPSTSRCRKSYRSA